MKLIKRKEMIKPAQKLESVARENEELIAIVSKSIDTAKKNKSAGNQRLP
jgi:hypothetical protein